MFLTVGIVDGYAGQTLTRSLANVIDSRCLAREIRLRGLAFFIQAEGTFTETRAQRVEHCELRPSRLLTGILRECHKDLTSTIT